jgi:hypothetical protein
MKNLAILLTVSLIAAAAAYFAFVSGAEIDEMTLIVDSGRAVIERDGDQIKVDESEELETGDLIRTDGVARLRLSGGRLAFLEDKARVSVTNDHALDGQGGSLRVQSTGGDAFRVTLGDIDANATNSNFRIDQGVGSARVGTYGGLVSLTSPGQPDLRVPQYFEAAVAVGDLPEDVRPYRFDTKDIWDREFLDSVMNLDEALISTVSPIADQRGGAKPPLGYFGSLADQNVDFMRRYLQRSTEDLLIGFMVAANAEEGSIKQAMGRAFRLHDDGGRWGLVAAILEARPGKLVSGLQALALDTGVADGGGDGAEAPEFNLAAGDPGPGDDDPPGPGEPVDPPEDPKDPKDPKDPDPPVSDDCSSGPECDIQEGVDELLPDDEPTPTPDDEEDPPPLTDGVLDREDGLP